MISTVSIPTIPNTAVKMLSTNVFPNEVRGVAQPLIMAAAAGLGQVESVMKAGELLLKKPQQLNYNRVRSYRYGRNIINYLRPSASVPGCWTVERTR